ncbi:MAG: hypothetical protein DMF66_02050 [Acidobacteria bacterium]|nr:MAG: hypothetical protein DMF66_02050 [Acidobacteriota bacterium]
MLGRHGRARTLAQTPPRRIQSRHGQRQRIETRARRGRAPENFMEQLDESVDGREIELTAGQEFELTLRENPSTGFRWRVTADGSPACALVRDGFRAPNEGRPGQGGSHIWQFRAAQAGQGRIEMSYTRTAGEAARTFTLSVRVAG